MQRKSFPPHPYLSVCLYDCQQDYASPELIYSRLSAGMEHGPGKKLLHFNEDLVKEVSQGVFLYFFAQQGELGYSISVSVSQEAMDRIGS